jgi:hypothetical protein
VGSGWTELHAGHARMTVGERADDEEETALWDGGNPFTDVRTAFFVAA